MQNSITDAETTTSSPAIVKQVLAAVPVRSFDMPIVEQSDKCPFCNDENITSGTWLQIGTVGTPCCWRCYVQA
jgi:hypothetical protein